MTTTEMPAPTATVENGWGYTWYGPHCPLNDGARMTTKQAEDHLLEWQAVPRQIIVLEPDKIASVAVQGRVVTLWRGVPVIPNQREARHTDLAEAEAQLLDGRLTSYELAALLAAVGHAVDSERDLEHEMLLRLGSLLAARAGCQRCGNKALDHDCEAALAEHYTPSGA